MDTFERVCLAFMIIGLLLITVCNGSRAISNRDRIEVIEQTMKIEAAVRERA